MVLDITINTILLETNRTLPIKLYEEDNNSSVKLQNYANDDSDSSLALRPSDNLHSARAHSRAQARAAVDVVGASLVLDELVFQGLELFNTDIVDLCEYDQNVRLLFYPWHTVVFHCVKKFVEQLAKLATV